MEHRQSGVLLSLLVLLAAIAAGCAGVRHVPAGSLLLDDVKIEVARPDSGAGRSAPVLDKEQMRVYLRQTENHRFLWSAKLQLGVYNLSGRDSTRWWNRWIRRLGEAPVLYSPALTEASASQLRQAMVNRGYLGASVEVDTVARPEKKKMNVTYRLHPGEAHFIDTISYEVPDTALASIVLSRIARSQLQAGQPLDMTALDQERERITRDMRNRGYYGFSKEQITFSADTTQGSRQVELTVRVSLPEQMMKALEKDASALSAPYYIKDVYVVMDYNPQRMLTLSDFASTDTITRGHLNILCNGKPYLRPGVIEEGCYITPGKPYRERDVTNTYEALGRLGILKFVSVQMEPAGIVDGKQWLDAYILLTPGKPQSIALELEGTNSEGDLGVAASATYSHRNLGRGSETFTAKVRGAYESLSGDLSGLIHDRYLEFSGDVGVEYPKFKCPFLSSSFKRRLRASTRVHASFNYQERPEYTRIIATAGFSYNWSERRRTRRHSWSPIDINYVYLPQSTQDFIDQIAPDNPLLRYSYEDHFIMSMAYRFYYSSRRMTAGGQPAAVPTFWDVRVNAEIAGNLLYAINSIFTHRSNAGEDPYKVFGIRYSQYAKLEANYTFTHVFDARNSVALHAALGVAYPYGNSRILPFEKRFYGGGANGVRGWDVRTLGPGSYDAKGQVSSFINQCGDILLTLSAEYRAKLFWVIEGALFIDAGNIWTIHAYEAQPGGMFHFNTFAKQLAASYGVGLRLNFNYFLLRFDLGMKAHNPAEGQQPWPLIHPRWGRDSSFHFSIGYPF